MEALEHFPVVTIQGARQVGKSTLVAHLPIEGLTTVTFDPVRDVGRAREDPDFFLQNQSFPLFLDEIQYAPELTASIKRLVDEKGQNGLVLLSGPQNLAVLRSISESMAGRAAVLDLYPLALNEIEHRTATDGVLAELVRGGAVDVESRSWRVPQALYPRIWAGGMPGLLELPEHLYALTFESYQRTYVERDVRTAADISSLHLFGRFIGLLAALTAQEINHNQLGRELGIDRKTALAWTDIATATFQWHRIPAYSRNAIKRIAGKPKGFFADTGFACYLQRMSSPEVLAQHPLTGNLFETWVYLEILKRTTSWPTKPEIHHYRAYSGAEVDLLLELDGVLYPIEAKMTSRPSSRDASGFASLRKTFPQARIGTGLIVCAVERPLWVRPDVLAIGWWEL